MRFVDGYPHGVSRREYGVMWHKTIAHQSTRCQWYSCHTYPTPCDRDIQQADDGSAC